MLVRTVDIETMRSASIPSPSKVILGRIVLKSVVLKTLGMSMPTLNAWIKKHDIQQLDHPTTGEKGLVLEDVCASLEMSEVLDHLDDAERLAEAPGKEIPDLNATEAADSTSLLEDLLRYAIQEGMTSTVEVLAPIYARRLEEIVGA